MSETKCAMSLRVGDTIVAEEDGLFWPFQGSPRVPQRLTVEARVVWVTSKAVCIKLPRTRVTLDGKPVLLPETRRELDRYRAQFSWTRQRVEPGEPSEWRDKPFYPQVAGQWAAAETATYYSAAAWSAYQGLFQEAMARPKEDGFSPHARLLGVGDMASREEVIAAFRAKAKIAHPDSGGDPEDFRRLVVARDLLLAGK